MALLKDMFHLSITAVTNITSKAIIDLRETVHKRDIFACCINLTKIVILHRGT